MTATDELRRLLDERGVEWEDDSPVPSMKQWKTSFTSFTGEEVTLGCYDEPKWIMGALVFHTPEQAVEATLGRGTCRYTPEFMHSYWDGDDEEHETDEGDPDGCCCICDQCGFEMMAGEDGWFYETEGPHGGLLYEPRFNFCPGCGREVEHG